mgnify:CR=1 FL=1
MKKLVLFLTLVVLGVCGYAQTVNIYRTNGEIVRTSSDSVSHISFVEKMDTIKIIGVDFGLPSGLLWANMNVGADNPEECGLYFAWGDTQGHRKEENFPFTWENYKWYDSESGNLTKYCVSDTLDVVDNKNTLDLEDDPANAAWGDGWRMPTAAEVKELLEYASVFYMANGFEIRHKLTPENVKIFCPFTGSFEGTKLKSGNISAKLWCSSLGEGGTKGADDFSYLNEKFEEYKELKNELPKDKILSYMKKLTPCCLAPMINHDIFSKKIIPNPGFFEDGDFIFPTDFLYYFENYEIGIPYEYESFLKDKIQP